MTETRPNPSKPMTARARSKNQEASPVSASTSAPVSRALPSPASPSFEPASPSLEPASRGWLSAPLRSPGSAPPGSGDVSVHASHTPQTTTNPTAKLASKRMPSIARKTVARPFGSIRSLVGGSILVSLLGTAAAITGCSSDPLEVDPDGPGTAVISAIIACKEDTDCKTGETCGNGFCQMKRCSDLTYESIPPLGKVGYAYLDRAFVTGGEEPGIKVFSSHAQGADKTIGANGAVLDIAGGNLTGKRPESVAFILEGASSVTVATPGGPSKDLSLGFTGKRLTVGDVDGDGVDEVVAIGEGGELAVCSAVEGSCKRGALGGPFTDVTVGDLDADGIGEILLVGGNNITIVNGTTRQATKTLPVTPKVTQIAAGDLDGDGKAEIVGTELGGAISDDKLYVLRINGAMVVQDATVDIGYSTFNDALDVAVTKQENKPVIGVLKNEGTLQLYTFANNALSVAGEVATNVNAKRIAASDVAGRSASVHLKEGPILDVGPPVPIAVITLPPYSAAHSQGPSSATMGTTEESSGAETHGSSKTTSVSLMLGGGLSYPFAGGGGAPKSNGEDSPIGAGGGGGGLGISLSAFVSRTWSSTVSRSKTTSITRSVGNSYTVNAEPQIDGYNSGGVVLAGGCFHRYEYTVDDPSKVLQRKEEGNIGIFVPVGGESSLWSTNRYNALVDALGDGRLPKVAIKPKLGNVSSYSAKPVTLDGKPIPKEDNVFPKAPVFRSSDVGTVGFSLTYSESVTNTDATAFSYGESTSVSLGVNARFVHLNGQVTYDTNWALDQSYAVTVGTSASFSGQVAPVRDDPTTPGNEASTYGYSFQPIVYRHHFKDKKGQEGAFYVMTYTAGK